MILAFAFPAPDTTSCTYVLYPDTIGGYAAGTTVFSPSGPYLDGFALVDLREEG